MLIVSMRNITIIWEILLTAPPISSGNPIRRARTRYRSASRSSCRKLDRFSLIVGVSCSTFATATVVWLRTSIICCAVVRSCCIWLTLMAVRSPVPLSLLQESGLAYVGCLIGRVLSLSGNGTLRFCGDRGFRCPVLCPIQCVRPIRVDRVRLLLP